MDLVGFFKASDFCHPVTEVVYTTCLHQGITTSSAGYVAMFSRCLEAMPALHSSEVVSKMFSLKGPSFQGRIKLVPQNSAHLNPGHLRRPRS